MRKSPRRQLEHNLASLIHSGHSTNVRVDALTEAEIKKRIQAIKFWDMLKIFKCPMCEMAGKIKLDSKADHGVNLRCESCGAHYEMSISRSLGARLIPRP